MCVKRMRCPILYGTLTGFFLGLQPARDPHMFRRTVDKSPAMGTWGLVRHDMT